jgi:orotate phosphoribosyltransferase
MARSPRDYSFRVSADRSVIHARVWQAYGLLFRHEADNDAPARCISCRGKLLFDKIRNDRDVEYIGGLEIGSIPLVTAIAAHSWQDRPVNAFFVRKIPKDHGTSKLIDGQFKPGSTVILFEDVTTTGGSVLKAVHAVRDQDCKVKRIITIVDRLEGADENLKKEGLALDYLFTTHDFSD